MKKIVNILLRSLAALSILAVPLGFVLSGSAMTRALDSVLHLRVDPKISGGEELARVYDPAGDDRGSGSLAYPTSARFAAPGGLDIVKYLVYEPLVGARKSVV